MKDATLMRRLFWKLLAIGISLAILLMWLAFETDKIEMGVFKNSLYVMGGILLYIMFERGFGCAGRVLIAYEKAKIKEEVEREKMFK